MIAVGTTVVRALETATDEHGTMHASHGWTDLTITPERGVRAVDGLLTGWHEPEASHLLMLEAFAGRDRSSAPTPPRSSTATAGTSSAISTCCCADRHRLPP